MKSRKTFPGDYFNIIKNTTQALRKVPFFKVSASGMQTHATSHADACFTMLIRFAVSSKKLEDV